MIYKLKDIALTTGHWQQAVLEMHETTEHYFPDMISIYIGVSNQNENIDWENENIGTMEVYDEATDSIKFVTAEYNGNIKNFSSIRESFDEKKGYFTYDDVELEAYNINNFWSDRVFHRTTKRIEIRIVGFKQQGDFNGYQGWYVKSKYDYEPIFAGIVLLDDYEVTFREGLKSKHTKYWSYKFRAFSILKILEQKTIDDLRTKLVKLYPPVYDDLRLQYRHPIATKAYSRYNNRDYECPFTENYELKDTTLEWEFIPISNIVKTIFSLTDLPLVPYTGFNIQSEFGFWQTGDNSRLAGGMLIPVKVDELYLPFRKWENGKEPKSTLNYKGGFYHRKVFDSNIFDSDEAEDKNKYKPPVDDNDVEARQWSFYNFNNCIELLCNISHSFGMVWYIKYSIKNNDKPYLFEATIKCTKRRYSIDDTPTAVVIKKLKEANVKVSSAELINGFRVTSWLGDYMIGTKDDITLNLLFALWNPNCVDYTSYNVNGSGLIWEHCLYYMKGDLASSNSYTMRLVDSVIIENIESDEPTTNLKPNRRLMEAIAKYYAGENSGVWGETYLTYDLTFLTAKGREENANVDTYQAIKPNHIITIENDDTLVITKVEKDIFNNNTKIEAIKY